MDKQLKAKQNEQLEIMRLTVMEQELSARSWKAYYEKMYYTLECEKLEVDYQACKDRAEKKLKEQQEAFEKLKQTLEKEVGEGESSKLKVEEEHA